MRLPNPARHCLRQLHQDCYFTAGDAVPGSRSRTAVPFERTYQLCSFECVVRSNDVSLGELVDRFLVPFRAGGKPTTGARTYVLGADALGAISLVVGEEEKVRGGSALDAVEYLLWEVSQRAIASGSSHLALHAGALSWRGTGVVLPAPSGSGKSTLTAGLTAAGCEYLSDEVALVDLESGMLHPFPRALGMSQRSIGFIPGLLERLPPELGASDRVELYVPPDAIRPSPIGGPCELRCVIGPEHGPGADTAERGCARHDDQCVQLRRVQGRRSRRARSDRPTRQRLPSAHGRALGGSGPSHGGPRRGERKRINQRDEVGSPASVLSSTSQAHSAATCSSRPRWPSSCTSATTSARTSSTPSPNTAARSAESSSSRVSPSSSLHTIAPVGLSR